MKSFIIFVALATQFVSGLPLSNLLNSDLTNALLGSAIGNVAIPGLPDGDVLDPLLEGVSIISNSGSFLSPVDDALGGALNIDNLDLTKRDPNIINDVATIDLLLESAVAASLGHPVLGSTRVTRDIANAIVNQDIENVLPHAKRILSNGIGGQIGTGLIELAGHSNHLGGGLVAVGEAGASGHIGRGLFDGTSGQIGTGVLGAAGILNHIGAGSLLVDGLGATGHTDGGFDGLGGQVGSGVIQAGGVLNHIGGGALVVGGLGGSGHVGR